VKVAARMPQFPFRHGSENIHAPGHTGIREMSVICICSLLLPALEPVAKNSRMALYAIMPLAGKNIPAKCLRENFSGPDQD
jgi:hypothetical protein